MSYHYLVDIALILISTKLLGMVTKRFQMPQVVGALLAGLIMGPAFLNIIHSTDPGFRAWRHRHDVHRRPWHQPGGFKADRQGRLLCGAVRRHRAVDRRLGPGLFL